MLSEDPHWTIDNMIFGDTHVNRHDRMLPNNLAIMQASNLFVFALNNPVRFIDPSGLFVIDAAQNFGRGARSGFVGFYQDLWHTVTNPADTIVAAGQSIADDPLRAYINMRISITPGLNTANQTLRYLRAHQNDGFYGLGVETGRDLGQASTVLAGYAAAKGAGVVVGSVGKKVTPVARAMTIDDVLANAVHTNTTRTGVQNFQASGGAAAARRHFDALNPTNVRTTSNGRIIGDLPGGNTVNIHPGTSVGGAPTLEIFVRSTRTRLKIRY